MDAKVEMVLIGGRLKEARERAGMSPADAVEAMGQIDPWFAMSPRTLANWEAGRNMPCLLQLRALCAVYGVTGHRLMCGSLPVEFGKEEASELSQLAATASPAVRRKLDILLSLVRALDEAEA